jgi:peptidoglycan/xylan/chitin deacetylase (PgdA/CDA1 family)
MRTSQCCPIFMMHRFEAAGLSRPHNVGEVRAILEYLRREDYEFLSLVQLAESMLENRRLPRKVVCFTIDDGFSDQYAVAGPLFAGYDAPLTVFLITGFLDGLIWPWDDQISYVYSNTQRQGFDVELPSGRVYSARFFDARSRKESRNELREWLKQDVQTQLYEWLPEIYTAAEVDIPSRVPEIYKPMTWADAVALRKAGHVLGAHTITHRILSRLSDGDRRAEVVGSVGRLREALGDGAVVFAYPTGRLRDFTAREYDALRMSDVLASVSTEGRVALHGDSIYALPRLALPSSVGGLRRALSNLEVARSWFNRARSKFARLR